MGRVGEHAQRLRKERGLTLAVVAAAIPCDKGHLSRVENGQRRPTAHLVRRMDQVLGARGELIAHAALSVSSGMDDEPGETAELLSRVRGDDTTPATIEALQATVHGLCCQYSWRNAYDLRREAQKWVAEVARLLDRPTGLRAHRELLTAAGWLALLIGCLEYDTGMVVGAEATRAEARRLGDEAGHADIVAWSWEMAAWFALTQGRWTAVMGAAFAGRHVADGSAAAVQLWGQEAKARARLGDVAGVRNALERGRRLLDGLPPAERPEHHFAFDPAKWDFLAMDALRLVGDDRRASDHAHAVLADAVGADGVERSPMRAAEARLTLAVVAARAGALEEAVARGVSAFEASRRSVPSLLMVADELDAELQRRFSRERISAEFGRAVRALDSAA